MTEQKQQEYVIYDGRAIYDMNSAATLERMGQFPDNWSVLVKVPQKRSHAGAVLAAYNQRGNAPLTNERMIGAV